MQTVSSTNEALKKRVEIVLDMAISTVSSLNEAFTSGVPLSTEEVAPPESIKNDKSASPSMGPDNPGPTLEAAKPEEVTLVADVHKQDSKGRKEKSRSQGPEVLAEGQVEERQGNEPGAEEESDSGSDDDAILQVHD